MTARVAFVVLAAAAAFLGSYALGQGDKGSASGASRPAAATAAPTGERAPVSRAVPVPATARLPGLRDAPAAPRRARRVVRRRAPAVAAAPAAAPVAPAAPKPAPKPDTGTPFFDAE